MHPVQLLLASLLLSGSFCAAAERPIGTSPTDADGDPLPRGAVARLGSTRWRLTHGPRNIILSPDGRTLAVTTYRNTTELIDVKTGRRLQCLGGTSLFGFGPRSPAAFSPDGKAIAYLDAVEWRQVLRIRNLGDERERSISFRTKDNYKPTLLPPEQKKGAQALERGEYITALAFSPDGKIIAAAVHFHIKIGTEKGEILRDVDENVVRRWDVSTGKELLACSGHTHTISGLFFSADGKTLTTASEDGTVRFWDTATGKENRRPWKAEGPLFSAAISPDIKWFAAGSKKTVLLWDIGKRELRHRLDIPAEEVRFVAFAPDSKLLAAGGGKSLRLWEPRSGKQMGDAATLPQPLAALAFSADGKELLFGHLWRENVVRRRKVAKLNEALDLNGHAGSVDTLVFTADGQRILTRGFADDYRCWDARTGKPSPGRDTDENLISRATSLERNALVFPQGNVIDRVGRSIITITVTRKPSRLRGIAKRRIERRPRGQRSRSWDFSGTVLSQSKDGKRLLIEQKKDKRSTLIVLDWEGYKRLRNLPQEDDGVCASLSPDGRTLAMAASDQLLFLDVDSGRQRRYPLAVGKLAKQLSSSSLIFSPDGSRLALLGQMGKVRIVSARNGRLLSAITAEGPDRVTGLFVRISGLAFSADGKQCACDLDGSPALWEAATGQRIRSIKGSNCLFSPDKRLLAVQQNEDTVCLYDLYSGKTFRTCKDPAGLAGNGHFLFSPDGRRLASTSQDTTALLWDAAVPETLERTTPLDEKTLERFWENMKTGKAPVAYSAMARLLADPRNTLPFLRKHLRQIPPVEEKRLRQWIADLDSDSFAKREAATRELTRLGPVADSALRAAQSQATSLEMRLRLKNLLQPLEGDARLSGEELAHMRAIQVLERIGTAEARQLLKHLAEGAEGVARTRDAQEALQRMGPNRRQQRCG